MSIYYVLLLYFSAIFLFTLSTLFYCHFPVILTFINIYLHFLFLC